MKICFAYAQPLGFSGQFLATKLLLDHLPSYFQRIQAPLPAWSGRFGHLPRYMWALFSAWNRIRHEMRCIEVFYINAGQSIAAIIRDGISLLIAKFSNPRSKAVISFNGNVFALWDPSSIRAKLFSKMCNLGGMITVVGPHQLESLLKMGVKSKIQIVDNASEFAPIDSTVLERKHAMGPPLKTLFLGNLLETKGYPEYLEALEIIAKNADLRVEAILAGGFIRDSYPVRFQSISEAEAWIIKKISEINQSSHVRIEWIKGISGAKKIETLINSQILVFPSVYPVEAQPFVLLEGLATGVSILTSRTGEIPSTLSDEEAVFLKDCSAPSIASGIYSLSNSDSRIRFSKSGLRLFQNRYTLSKYIEVWERLLSER